MEKTRKNKRQWDKHTKGQKDYTAPINNKNWMVLLNKTSR